MMNIQKKILIIAATGNEHKAGEFRAIINTVLSPDLYDLITQKEAARIAGDAYVSPNEDGNTFAENAYIKSSSLESFLMSKESFKEYASGYDSIAVIADDSGLCVDALGGAPGIYSARYASKPGSFEDADDLKNVEKLLNVMNDVPDDRRTGRFTCHISVIVRFGGDLSSRVRIETAGDFKGVIDHEMKGSGGFGYDPILFLPEYGVTSAMLSPEEKNRLSHRGRALRMAAREIYGCIAKL